MTEWPKCLFCSRTVLNHDVRGLVAKCDPRTGRRASFSKAHILEARAAAGLTVTGAMLEAVAREKAKA